MTGAWPIDTLLPMSAIPKTPVFPTEPVFPLSVEQYHAMIEAGTLTDDDPVELIEGVLVFRMPKNPPHAMSVGQFQDFVPAMLHPGWIVRLQESLTLADGEPEPDVVIARGNRRDYASRHPGPNDAGLVVEVADSTVSRDRGMKLRSYARAGIANYWIVNIPDQQLEMYSEPHAEGDKPSYRRRDDATLDQTVSLPAAVGGATLLVRELFEPTER